MRKSDLGVASLAFLAAGAIALAAAGAGTATAKAPTCASDEAWQTVATSDWQPREAAYVMEIVAPACRGFPESAEGKPSLSIELDRAGDRRDS